MLAQNRGGGEEGLSIARQGSNTRQNHSREISRGWQSAIIGRIEGSNANLLEQRARVERVSPRVGK